MNFFYLCHRGCVVQNIRFIHPTSGSTELYVGGLQYVEYSTLVPPHIQDINIMVRTAGMMVWQWYHTIHTVMLPDHSLLLFIVHVGREVDESLLLLSENNNESQQRNDIMLYPAGYWYWYLWGTGTVWNYPTRVLSLS